MSAEHDADKQPYITQDAAWLARLERSLPQDLPGPPRVLIAADRPRLFRDVLIAMLAAALAIVMYGSAGGPSWFAPTAWAVTTMWAVVFLRQCAAADTICVGPDWLARRRVSGTWSVLSLSSLAEVRSVPPAIETPSPVKLIGAGPDGVAVSVRVRSQAWDKAVRPHLLVAPELQAALRQQVESPLPLKLMGREVPES